MTCLGIGTSLRTGSMATVIAFSVAGMSPKKARSARMPDNDVYPENERPDSQAPDYYTGWDTTKRLYATTDAMVWAQEWCRIAREIEAVDDGRQIIDEGWMVGWFANAMCVAEDHLRRRLEAEHGTS